MRGMPTADFPGIRRPTIDFQDVRDGRRSTPFYVEVDLATARTIAAGTQLALPIAGNSFYADPIVDSSGNPIGGVAIVHFQDTTLNPQGTPFTVGPQFIANVPFTQVLIENPAQPGKRLRIIYGVDVDFRPGINAQVNITNTVAMRSAGQNYGAKFASTVALGIAATETIWLPAANTSGAIVHAANLVSQNGAALNGGISTHLHTAAPAAFGDGDNIAISCDAFALDGAARWQSGKLANPIAAVAGKGAYFFNASGVAEGGGKRSMLYTLS